MRGTRAGPYSAEIEEFLDLVLKTHLSERSDAGVRNLRLDQQVAAM